MMTLNSSLLKMKKNPGEMLAKLKGEAEKQTKGGKRDVRFWSPTFNKEKGAGSATIRFLPAMSDDALPWVQVYHRSFQGAGKAWYFENDLSTLGRKDDPVYDLTKRLYASGIKSDEEVAKPFKRKVKYIANALVIRDPANPEAEGKVFLYDYGSQIADVIGAAREPKFEDQVALEPFNPWYGAPLNIRITAKVRGNDVLPNYEQSTFGTVAAMADEDEKILDICSKGYDLGEFIAPDKFKTVEELKRLMFEVLGPTVGSGVETVPGWGTPASNTQTRRPRTETQKPAPEKTDLEDDVDGGVPDAFAGDEAELEAAMSGSTPDPTVPAVAPVSDDDMEFMQNLMG